MAANRKARRKARREHKIVSKSLVAWRCSCGAPWYNDHLRGKTDGELETERDIAFTQHERDMEKEGF